MVCARSPEATGCQRSEYPCFPQVVIKMLFQTGRNLRLMPVSSRVVCFFAGRPVLNWLQCSQYRRVQAS